MTEKRPGPAPGVRLIEVSVKRELTVDVFFSQLHGHSWKFLLIGEVNLCPSVYYFGCSTAELNTGVV